MVFQAILDHWNKQSKPLSGNSIGTLHEKKKFVHELWYEDEEEKMFPVPPTQPIIIPVPVVVQPPPTLRPRYQTTTLPPRVRPTSAFLAHPQVQSVRRLTTFNFKYFKGVLSSRKFRFYYFIKIITRLTFLWNPYNLGVFLLRKLFRFRFTHCWFLAR